MTDEEFLKEEMMNLADWWAWYVVCQKGIQDLDEDGNLTKEYKEAFEPEYQKILNEYKNNHEIYLRDLKDFDEGKYL